jgi:hypothetical protein
MEFVCFCDRSQGSPALSADLELDIPFRAMMLFVLSFPSHVSKFFRPAVYSRTDAGLSGISISHVSDQRCEPQLDVKL